MAPHIDPARPWDGVFDGWPKEPYSQLDIDLCAMRYTVSPPAEAFDRAGDYPPAAKKYMDTCVDENDRAAFWRVFAPEALLAAHSGPVSVSFRVRRGGESARYGADLLFSRIGDTRHVCVITRRENGRGAAKEPALSEEIVSLIGINLMCSATVSLSDWLVHFIKKPAILPEDSPDAVPFDNIRRLYAKASAAGGESTALSPMFDPKLILDEIDRRGFYEVETRGVGDEADHFTMWRMLKLPSDPGTLFIRQQDITAGKQAESARREAEVERQANRSKSMFLANVSHEIRTPLNAILGYAELLLTGRPLPPEEEADVRRISDAGSTLLEIVDNILDLSKVESGQFVVRPDLYETRRLVDELSGSAIMRIKSKPISFSAECAEDLPRYLYGDAVLVKQVIMNLLSNAAKYTDEGFITMRMVYRDENLQVRVSDTGIGIRPEDQQRIFNKFERLEANAGHFIEGTGLGLALTKQLVEQMGGFITVESVYGSGSVFSVSLPQGTGEPSAPPEGPSRSVTAPGVKVLLVDDNSVNLTVTERLLRRFELEVYSADRGEDCLELLSSGGYDLVLLDHMMPGMDGVETLHRIREIPGCERLTVIALTANAMKGMREFFIGAGFDDYMPKPVNLEAIAAMLKKWVPDRLSAAEPETAPGEALPEVLSKCGGIDIGEAMQYSGSYADLLTTICDFAGLIEVKSRQLESFAASGDIPGFTVEVHALKSSSRLIGAVRLSELAARLERMGREKDLAGIQGLAPQLISIYRGYAEKLRPAAETRCGIVTAVEIGPEELKIRLSELRLMLEDFDIDSADSWAAAAAGYKLSGELQEKMEALSTAIRMIDYLGAIKTVDEMAGMLP